MEVSDVKSYGVIARDNVAGKTIIVDASNWFDARKIYDAATGNVAMVELSGSGPVFNAEQWEISPVHPVRRVLAAKGPDWGEPGTWAALAEVKHG
jgi:hypothetical protein